jgi:hypothetical protein
MQAIGLEPAAGVLLAGSITRAEETIALLRRSLSKATFGDLIDAVVDPWSRLQTAMKPPSRLGRLLAVDLTAEDLLQNAERLVANLEAAGLASTLRVINVSGRQRMLVQRAAKLALIEALTGASPAPVATTVDAFSQGMTYLHAVPLSTVAIRADLDRAESLWRAFRAAMAEVQTVEGQVTIATLSETLVELFDQLTDQYERSMQMLLE